MDIGHGVYNKNKPVKKQTILISRSLFKLVLAIAVGSHLTNTAHLLVTSTSIEETDAGPCGRCAWRRRRRRAVTLSMAGSLTLRAVSSFDVCAGSAHVRAPPPPMAATSGSHHHGWPCWHAA